MRAVLLFRRAYARSTAVAAGESSGGVAMLTAVPFHTARASARMRSSRAPTAFQPLLLTDAAGRWTGR
eukprot:1126816-Rhodomonas_salina.2